MVEDVEGLVVIGEAAPVGLAMIGEVVDLEVIGKAGLVDLEATGEVVREGLAVTGEVVTWAAEGMAVEEVVGSGAIAELRGMMPFRDCEV